MAKAMDGYTGADIQAICEEATLLTIRRAVSDKNINTSDKKSVEKVQITKAEFDKAIEKVLKSAQRAQKALEHDKELPEDLYR